MSSNFHLFIALAILEKHRDVIMEHLKHFDEVLKYGMFHSSVVGILNIWREPNELFDSQRTVKHNRPILHPPPRPSPLPPLSTHGRSSRQAE